MQVKIFSGSTHVGLEKKINEWLSINGKKVKVIKQSMSASQEDVLIIISIFY